MDISIKKITHNVENNSTRAEFVVYYDKEDREELCTLIATFYEEQPVVVWASDVDFLEAIKKKMRQKDIRTQIDFLSFITSL